MPFLLLFFLIQYEIMIFYLLIKLGCLCKKKKERKKGKRNYIIKIPITTFHTKSFLSELLRSFHSPLTFLSLVRTYLSVSSSSLTVLFINFTLFLDLLSLLCFILNHLLFCCSCDFRPFLFPSFISILE